MLIESYDLEVEVSKHSAEEFEYEAIARLDVDYQPALPYLNATLTNGTYFSDGPVFSWRQDSHNIGFWPDRIAVDHLDTREQASEMIERLVTWSTTCGTSGQKSSRTPGHAKTCSRWSFIACFPGPTVRFAEKAPASPLR